MSYLLEVEQFRNNPESRDRQPVPPHSSHSRAQRWHPATGWREEPPGGGSAGGWAGREAPRFPGFYSELSVAVGLGTGERQEENREVSAVPSGYTQLPANTETRFSKQSLSFFNHFFPLW